MQPLPIGFSDFALIRRKNLLYVDKTAYLQNLIETGGRYFLSRPRRFGKSLTLSTLKYIFQGREDLFVDLAAHDFVSSYAKRPCHVLHLDLSTLQSYSTIDELNESFLSYFYEMASKHRITLFPEKKADGLFLQIINKLYEKYDQFVLLIDEYDKPILDHIQNLDFAKKIRDILASIYIKIKSKDECFNFIFLTGISKFTKTGVFSALNNLNDISMNYKYGSLLGYTQDEMEFYFKDCIIDSAKMANLNTDKFLEK
ncbi:MAG: AAA family ATPase, partial [Desulfovibrionaceae bacterium]|nr:AAA family ATPase [Desulfovibrionaceae bacterium]